MTMAFPEICDIACDCIAATSADARALMTGPGNPWPVWHGEARVMTSEMHAALAPESGWQTIICRDDLTEIDPEVTTYSDGGLALSLTLIAQDVLPAGCHEPGCPFAPRP